MNPASTDPLAQLRDIHLPAPVDWWPPAPGWWLLGCLSLALLTLLVWQMRRYWQSRQYRRTALQLLRQIAADNESPLTGLQQLNQLLKRTALSAYPQLPVAGLHGPEWIAFLRQAAPRIKTTPAIESLLGHDLYAPQLTQNVALDPVCDFVRQWIRYHLPAKKLKPRHLSNQPLAQCLAKHDPAPVKSATGGVTC